MSLVAGLVINGSPLIMGDLLLSSEEDPNNRVSVPTIGNTERVFPIGSGIVPSGMRQKLSIINENLIVGWAGSRIGAKMLISDLRSSNIRSHEELSQFLCRSKPVADEMGVQLTGFHSDSGGILQFGLNDECVTTKQFGAIRVQGSGAEDAKRLLMKGIPNLPQVIQGQPENVIVTISFGLALIGGFVGNELATSAPLGQYYGGGYEIASFIGGRFQKIENYTFLFWAARIENSSLRMHPQLVLNYSYFREFLMIRTARITERSGLAPICKADHEVHVVPPINRELTEFPMDAPKASMNSRLLCSYFLIPRNHHDVDIFSCIHGVGLNDEAPIKFEEGSDGMILLMKTDFMTQIAKAAVDQYQHHLNRT